MDELKDWTIIQVENFEKLGELEKTKSSEYTGYVYVVEWDDNVKIGCTQSPFKRMKDFNVFKNYTETSIGKVAISKECTNYRQIENFLHRYFSKYRYKGTELFDMSLEQAMSLMPEITFIDETAEKRKQADKLLNFAKNVASGKYLKQEDKDMEDLEKSIEANPDKWLHSALQTMEKKQREMDLLTDLVRALKEIVGFKDEGLIKYYTEYPADMFIDEE